MRMTGSVQGVGYRPVDDLSASADGRGPKASREGDGGARGAAARSKVPTIIMRPRQQGHGGRWSAAAPAAGSASSRSTGGSVTGTGMAISSLARAIFFLQVALASSP